MRPLTIIIGVIALIITSCTKDKAIQDGYTYSIEYLDWLPDLVITDSTFLDLDSNGVNDIMFFTISDSAGSTPSGGIYYNEYSLIKSVNSNASFSFGIQLLTNITYPNSYDCLNEGEIINNDLTWYDNSYSISIRNKYFSGIYVYRGIWDVNTNNGYIGVKLTENSGDNYYWIKLSATNYSITLEEMGGNKNVNQPIHAGQKE